MLELCREGWLRFESVDNPGFSSKILLAGGDGFELSSETQQRLKELSLVMVIVGPIGCQYRTWCNATLRVGRQEDENVELRRGQSQVLALHSSRRSIVLITKSPISIIADDGEASTFAGLVALFANTFRKLQIPAIV